jgi:hypothetical protein
MDSALEHVTDFSKIAANGVMTTPALVVDDKGVSYGKVLKVEEVVKETEGYLWYRTENYLYVCEGNDNFTDI